MIGKTNVTVKGKEDLTLTGNAVPEHVLAGEAFYSNNAKERLIGTMPNNNGWANELEIKSSTQDQYIYIPTGYFDGNATPLKINKVTAENKEVNPTTCTQYIHASEADYLHEVKINAIQTQSKTVTPSTSKQTVSPETGKLLSSVVVNPIPAGVVQCRRPSSGGGRVTTKTSTSVVVDSTSSETYKAAYIGILNGKGSIDGSNDQEVWENIGNWTDTGSDSAFNNSSTSGYVQNQKFRYYRFRFECWQNGGQGIMYYVVFMAG